MGFNSGFKGLSILFQTILSKKCWSWVSAVNVATRLQVGWSGVWIPVEEQYLSAPKHPDGLLGPPSLLSSRQYILSWGWYSQDVKVTTHLCLGPSTRMSAWPCMPLWLGQVKHHLFMIRNLIRQVIKKFKHYLFGLAYDSFKHILLANNRGII